MFNELKDIKERHEKMTTLYLRSDDAYRARVSDNIGREGFFSDVYIRANLLVNEITNTMTRYEEEISFPRSMGNNTILFTAARGQGKTSAMNTFASFLAKEVSEDIFNERDCRKDKEYEVLGIIDPTMMNQSESIVRVFLSRLFNKFEEKVGEEEQREKRDSESQRGRDRIELLKLFSKCYDNVNFLESTDKNYMEFNDLDSLARLGSSTELRKNIRQLVRKYLAYVSGTDALVEDDRQTDSKATKRYLVLQIDDADLSAGNIFAICEQIREYLRIPGVIVLMAADFSQLRNSVFQEYLTQYKNLIKLQNRIEIVDTCYRKTWRYLEKMFPEGHRIYLPELIDVLRNNSNSIVINYDDVVEDIQINMNNALCSDVQEQLIWLIYDRTGIIFAKNERGMKSLFPETMRQLTQFIMEIGSMEHVDHAELVRDVFWPNSDDLEADKRAIKSVETLQSNLERFYNYFFHEWVYSRVDKKVFKILKKIIKEGVDTVKACMLIDGKLNKAKKDSADSKGGQGQNNDNQTYSADYEGMSQSEGLYQLIVKSKLLEKTKNYYEGLTEAISLLYSIKMNEWFLELIKYSGKNRLLEFSNIFIDNDTGETEKESRPLYYHFRIDYDEKRSLGSESAWAAIFLSDDPATDEIGSDERNSKFYNKIFDVWNPIYNIMQLMSDHKQMKEVITSIHETDRHNEKWNEWDMLLGIRLIVTNVDVRNSLIYLLEEEKKSIQDELPWLERLTRLYQVFDQWHINSFKFLSLPNSFSGLCNLVGVDEPLSSFLFLANQKNYDWYCSAYAQDIMERYQKLISLLESSQETFKTGSVQDDGNLLRLDITQQKRWKREISTSSLLRRRRRIDELDSINKELDELNYEVLDAIYVENSDSTAREQTDKDKRLQRIEELITSLSANVDRLQVILKNISAGIEEND